MLEKFIPVNEPLLQGNELKYLSDCISSGWISSEGHYVHSFEENFSKSVNRKHSISVVNGTTALDIAFAALNIGPGDEVILPTFTIISCVHQILRSGATPVFVDCDPVTFNASPEDIIARVTPSTKAILVVHIYGLPVDMDPIINYCESNNIYLIEDAAEMIGQTYKTKPCGSFGDISTFSFYANKHITTGEGGMISTNDDDLADSCRSFRNLCFQKNKRFVHEKIGWNARMTNLQAAVGLAQLEQLSVSISKKRDIGNLYNSLLSCVPYITLPLEFTSFSQNIYWVYTVLLDSNQYPDASRVMQDLSEYNIGTRPFFFPLHQQPCLSSKESVHQSHFPNAEYISRYGFYLPSGLALSDGQINYVADSLIHVLKKYV